MSKRTSTTKLDHDNWDKEEVPEDAGSFSPASTDVLKKRVILKAQRRGRAVKPAEGGSLPAVPNIFQNIKLTGISSVQPSFSFSSSNNVSESKKTESAAAKVQTGFVFGNTASTTEAPNKAGELKFSFASSAPTPASQGVSATSVPTSDTGSISNFAMQKPLASGISTPAITSALSSDTGSTGNFAVPKFLVSGTSTPVTTSASTSDTGSIGNFAMQKPLASGTSTPSITSALSSDTGSTGNFAMPKFLGSGTSTPATTSASTSDTGSISNFAMPKPLVLGTSAPAIASALTSETSSTSNFAMPKPLVLGTSAPAIASALTSETSSTSNFAMPKPLVLGTSAPAIASALISDTSSTSNFAMPKPLASGTSAPAITSAQMFSSVFSIKTASTSSGGTPTTNGSQPSAPAPLPSGNIFSAGSIKPFGVNTMHKKFENKADTGQFSFVIGNKKNEALPEHAKNLPPEENVNKKSDQPSSNNFIDKDKYFLMLKGLNKSVASWIKDSVDKNPHCILTPIFSDYITYLNDIRAKYYKRRTGVAGGENKTVASSSPASPPAQDRDKTDPSSAPMVNGKDTEQCSGFLLPISLPQNSVLQAETSADQSQVPAPFSFPVFGPPKVFSSPQTSGQLSSATVDKSGESASSSRQELVPESKTDKTEETNDDDDEAEPPEPTPAPVVEEGAVYSKRCKVFVKKSGSYQDRGVGTAFIKPVVDNTKTQLIVRADTVLGNVLLNTLVSSSVPIQRLGPNNVAVVCVPTPDEKPPPTTVLLRVKTSADADQLYAKLNAYRK